MKHPFSNTCDCYDCVATGPTSCTKTRGCWLTRDHAGECAGAWGFARLTAREFRRIVVRWMAGAP